MRLDEILLLETMAADVVVLWRNILYQPPMKHLVTVASLERCLPHPVIRALLPSNVLSLAGREDGWLALHIQAEVIFPTKASIFPTLISLA